MTYPQRFGPYTLERFLAAGGMAEVFVATRPDGKVPGPIALKRMLPQMMENAEYAGMFRDEAALASRLVHRNIVRVWDSGEYDGRLYMAMELIEGLDASSLQKKLRAKNEMLGLPQALRIGVDLCAGLAAAHAMKDERGVALMLIHRDVSPQNILISRDGVIKVTDFGVAKATGRETHTATGNIKGKIPYMAPEQALAQHLDQRVDQFAAGIVVWELLTGTRLFQDKNDLLMFEKIIRRPTPKPSSVRQGIPPSVDNVVLRALAKNPDERYPDVGTFGKALLKCLNEMGGYEAADLAPIVDYVLPPAPIEQSQSGRSQSQKTPASSSRPTGAPIAAATLDDENQPTMAVPPRSDPGVSSPTPATTPRPAARPAMAEQQTRPKKPVFEPTGPQFPPETPSSSPSVQSSSNLTLDRPRRQPAGVEMQQTSGPIPAVPIVAAAEPRAFPIAFVAVALVVGIAAGFGIAKATEKAPPPAATGCARPSTATGDVEAAYDLLLKAQMNLEAGDLEKAAQKAQEAQARSGTANGHYLLGRIRMQSGDVGAGLNHYRCVFELAPGGDEAKKLTTSLKKL